MILTPKSKIKFFFVFFVVIVFSGCAGLFQRSVFQNRDINWNSISQLSYNNYKRLKTLDGWAKLTVQSPIQSFTADIHIRLKNPDSLYLKIEAAFGIDVGLFFADRQKYLIYSPMQNLCYTGSVDSLYKAPLFDIEISYDKLLQVFAGTELPVKIYDQRIEKNENSVILYGRTDSLFYKYTLETRYGLVKELQIRDAKNELLALHEFSRFSRINGVVLPQTIKVKRPKTREAISLFYTRLKINKKFKQDDFSVKMPESVLKVNL